MNELETNDSPVKEFNETGDRKTACDGESQTELSSQTINSLIRKAQNGDIKSLKKLKMILGD